MPQGKPASGRRTKPIDESHLPRPRVTQAGVRRGPDPYGHARALIQTHGLEQSVAIASSNVVLTKEEYWQEVLAALSAIAAQPSESTH